MKMVFTLKFHAFANIYKVKGILLFVNMLLGLNNSCSVHFDRVLQALIMDLFIYAFAQVTL